SPCDLVGVEAGRVDDAAGRDASPGGDDAGGVGAEEGRVRPDFDALVPGVLHQARHDFGRVDRRGGGRPERFLVRLYARLDLARFALGDFVQLDAVSLAAAQQLVEPGDLRLVA